MDRGVMAPVDPPLYRLNNRYEIVRGEGDFEGASGYLQVHGSLIVDFTFQHPQNGDTEASYRGRVCT